MQVVSFDMKLAFADEAELKVAVTESQLLKFRKLCFIFCITKIKLQPCFDTIHERTKIEKTYNATHRQNYYSKLPAVA